MRTLSALWVLKQCPELRFRALRLCVDVTVGEGQVIFRYSMQQQQEERVSVPSEVSAPFAARLSSRSAAGRGQQHLVSAAARAVGRGWGTGWRQERLLST